MRHRSTRERRRNRFRPELSPLEGRQLLATAVANLKATPNALSPPNGRYVKVEVTGNVVDSHKNLLPQVQFTLIDEYRRNETSFPVKLTRITSQVYSFDFTISLEARRADSDNSGRQYNLIVGSSDLDNSQGQFVSVLVPHDPLPNGQTQIAPYATRHPGLPLKKLPPLNPTPRSSPLGNLFGNLGGLGGNKTKKK